MNVGLLTLSETLGPQLRQSPRTFALAHAVHQGPVAPLVWPGRYRGATTTAGTLTAIVITGGAPWIRTADDIKERRRSSAAAKVTNLRTTTSWGIRGTGRATLLLLLVLSAPVRAQDDSELAKKTQNPVAELISVPFENNVRFGVGPQDDVQYILNIQPIVPFRLTDEWNLISRTIVPVIYQPELAPGAGETFGLGDIQQSFFLSPAKPGAVIWGAEMVLQFPTATDDVLGQEKWEPVRPSVC